MQKDLTKVKILPKVFFWWGLLFSETPCGAEASAPQS